MRTASETFGVSGTDIAAAASADANSMPSPVATTRLSNQPPANAFKALLDPSGSAIFWIGLAALLGLVLVHGEARIDTKLGLGVGGRAGRRGK